MQAEPLVSVTIPAFNAARFLARTLDSVFAQTYKAFEVIVVDDGSTDGTPDLVRTYEKRDPRIRLYSQANMGPSAARNAAIAKSSGEFIAPLDADDIWYPEKLRKQVDCMLQSGPRTGVVYAWTIYMDEEGALTGGYSASTEEGNVYLRFLCHNFLANGSVALVRRTCLTECGGYRTEFSGLEEKELFLRIAALYEFKVVPEFLVGYRIVRGSTSHGHARIEQCYKRLLDEVKQGHPDIPPVVYRWSRGVSYTFMASRSLRSRHLGSTVKYLSRAIWNDPMVPGRAMLGRLRRLLQRRSFASHADAQKTAVLPIEARGPSNGSGLTLHDIAERARRCDNSPLMRATRRRLETLEMTLRRTPTVR